MANTRISIQGTAATRYIHPDHLGSTNIVTDENGNVADTLEYYPYGESRLNQPTYPTNEARQYIAQFKDGNSLSYLNARYYDSGRGQFESEDPVFLGDPSQQNLQDPQSLNSYSYANDNPITQKDPTGQSAAIAIPLAIIAATLYVILTILSSPQLQHASAQATSAILNQSVQIVRTVTLPIPQPTVFNLAAPTFGPGKNFSPGTKQDAIEKNPAENGGQPTCTKCGTPTVPAGKGQKGVTTPGSETNVDHVIPKSRGGTNDPLNADVLCRDCNLKKGNNMPWEMNWEPLQP